MHSDSLAPEIVEMKDTDGQTYLVDKDVSHILMNRRIWTDTTGTLIIEVAATWAKNIVFEKPLATWILRIMTPHDLPDKLQVAYRDGNPRNLVYANLKRMYTFTPERNTHDSAPQSSNP